ncbi:MAG: hypothetical protein JRK53_24750 [Deltaproteobacteria bacterium]|nr:hypothetical protein [Deltaproteobacteria bacterium]
MKCKETGFHHRHAIPQAISRPAKMTWKSAEKLKAADETLGIPVLNHIIFSHKGYYDLGACRSCVGDTV